jgi:hypothetical protein
MTSPIMPVQGGLQGPSNSISAARDVPGDAAVFKAELAASDRGLVGDSAWGSPPPEVLDQIETAGRISRQMRESGHELRFSEGPGGRVTIELADREGKTVRTMLAAEALEISAGKPSG